MSNHPFNKSKLGFRFFVFRNRINSIRKDILILALISLGSILIIELWLIKVPAPNNFFHTFGNIWLKLSYSFFSAFLFYYLVVHLPKERRKLKSFRQISNKIHNIEMNVFAMLDSVLGGNLDPKDMYNLKAETIKEASKKINPCSPIMAQNFISQPYIKTKYENWFVYMNEIVSTIKTATRDILLLNESIDISLLEAITHIDDTASWLVHKSNANYDSYEFIGHRLNQLKNELYDLRKAFGKAYSRYTIEYHTYQRKKNLELINQEKL